MKIVFTVLTFFVSLAAYSQTCDMVFSLNQRPVITYNGNSPAITKFMANIPKELNEAIALGEQIIDHKIKIQISNISVTDAIIEGGNADGQALMIEKKITNKINKLIDEGEKAESLLNAFIHEVGHHVFNHFMLIKFPAFKKYYADYVQLKKLNEARDRNDSDQFTRLIESLKFFEILTSPYEEFMADIFRAVYLHNSGGKNASRDLNRVSERITNDLSNDEHDLFNPVRQKVWDNLLSPNIHNTALLIQIFRIIAESSIEVMEENRIPYSENLQGFKHKVTNVLELNYQLWNKIQINMKKAKF